jgi:HTH-type transcriptional regulator/antitoxin HipB
MLDYTNVVRVPDYAFVVKRCDSYIVVRGDLMTYRAPVRSSAALGLALQQARMAAGITQRQLAERVGASQRYIWELEAGNESLVISRILGVLRETGAEMILEIPEGDND